MKIFPPILLLIGTCGNIANYYAFNKSHMKVYSTFRFLSYLSLVDLLVLLVGLPQMITMAFTKDSYDFRSYSNFICSTHSFLTMYFTHLSSNLLAAVSIDRVFIITNLRPNQKKTLPIPVNKSIKRNEFQLKSLNAHLKADARRRSTRKSISKIKAKGKNCITKVEYITLVIALVIFLFDSHFLIWMRLNNHETSRESLSNQTSSQNILCYPLKDQTRYYYFFTKVWPWLDLLVYCYIPFTIMIICTMLIITRLFRLNHSMRYLNTNIKQKPELNKREETKMINLKNMLNSQKNEPSSNTNTNASGTNLSESNNNNNDNNTKNENTTPRRVCSSDDMYKRRARKNRQIYHVLLCLNFVFFLLVTPVVIFNSIGIMQFNNNNELLTVLGYFLAYSNHTFNFIFYFLSSKPYRDIFKNLFRSYKETFFKAFFNIKTQSETGGGDVGGGDAMNILVFSNDCQKDNEND